MHKAIQFFYLLLIIFTAGVSLTRSMIPINDPDELIHSFTRKIEFDYVNWTIDALNLKNTQGALVLPRYIPVEKQKEIVLQNLTITGEIEKTEQTIEQLYAQPDNANADEVAKPYKHYLSQLLDYQSKLGPLAEAILEQQVGSILADLNLTLAGQPVPPPLFHTTPLPKALIISPRDIIRQDQNISLNADQSIDEIIQLENNVEKDLDVSALVVSIGGVGVYPTMVLSSTDLGWLSEVISHEWVHNYLTLRPLGLNYETSPELRTINETVASIAGKEIGRALLEKFYPELLPPPPPDELIPQPAEIRPEMADSNPPPFDFRKEMRITRETADVLLEQGKIDEAEAYMEERRQFLWENGYQIRKLNQAYFAFHGAYADEAGGAAGDDPVGEAVRQLRSQSTSLTDFINRASWITTYEQLERIIQGGD
jgi:hypothetical protein